MMDSTPLDGALAAVRRGWWVFPLQVGGKEPYDGFSWTRRASNSEEQVLAWATMYPDANWAVHAGKSGLAVLDIDVKHGAPGPDSLLELELEYGDLPLTYTVRTPSGGWHRYFVGASRSKNGFLPGLDMKAGIEGRSSGYVLLPGSVIDGKRYEIVDGREVAALPGWLPAIMDAKAEPDKIPTTLSDTNGTTAYGQKALELEVGKVAVARKGKRNETLNKASFALGQLVSGGEVDKDTALGALKRAALAAGLPSGEAEKTIMSGFEAGRKEPRTAAVTEFTSMGKDDRKPCQRVIAEEVVERIGADNIRHDSRVFWRWDGLGLWKRVDDAEVKQVSLDVLTHRGKVTRSSVDSVTDLVKTLIYSPEVMEPTQPFVNCTNGELHWTGSSWELRPHQKGHLATSRIPVPWEDWEADCPRFDRFLDEVFQPDDDALEKRQLLLELMGYSLVPSAKYEKFALLVGNGANGKSVLLNVLQALLGRENCAAVSPCQFGNRFQKAHLHGKLINIVTELPEGAVIADAELKAIVSGELITAEHKLQKPFDFRPTCTVWIATNHMPGTRDFSDALFRRACVIRFNRTFSESEQDKQLADKLMQELPGILYSALEAYGNVLRRGAFTMPPSVTQARQEWRLDADQVAAFIDDEIDRVPGEKIESQLLYNNYRHWAAGAGIGRLLGRKAFTQRLVRLGFETGKGSGGVRTIWGAKLKGATEEFH